MRGLGRDGAIRIERLPADTEELLLRLIAVGDGAEPENLRRSRTEVMRSATMPPVQLSAAETVRPCSFSN
jgi:hypothetical protein